MYVHGVVSSAYCVNHPDQLDREVKQSAIERISKPAYKSS